MVVSHTSCLPPEQARERAVSLVRSDWASISAEWSRRIATVTAWPAHGGGGDVYMFMYMYILVHVQVSECITWENG